MTHRYCWRNNEKRLAYHGRLCRVLARGTMNSILVEFENGERTVTSRYAVRKITPPESAGTRTTPTSSPRT
jgi:hypothetical protein